MTNWRFSEPQKYWSLPATLSPSERHEKIDAHIQSGGYMASLKTDGIFSRAIIGEDNPVLQTRTISEVTSRYGEIQDKVFWWNDVVKAFDKYTVLLGEVFLNGGRDKDVGSITHSLKDKALCIQSEEYYKTLIAKGVKITPKSRSAIEKNPFFNRKLHWRIFDVLVWEGEDISAKGMEERASYIEKAVRKINSPLVHGVKYWDAEPETFWDKLQKIFESGGEGCVLYKRDGTYNSGTRTAWKTIKVKQEVTNEVDCFITGIEPATQEYTGKDIPSWTLWYNIKTGEKLQGMYYSKYQMGELNIIPVTKNFFNDWPGAIVCSVYDDNDNIIELCRCSGLNEEMKTSLRDNFNKEWHMRPITLSAMQVSSDRNGQISLRHPVLKTIRNRDDIDIKDCSLRKILGGH